ncbi:ribosomal subunit 39S-domain-containing protein [Hypoxylon sp. FL0543]|nr:ribosomal subunit 39S-domain-containing protein [Hypoxylon sp. FL0543]
MRRIPRLRRPSSLSASTSRSLIAPLVVQCPATSAQAISASNRRPVPASFQCLTFTRLYSSDTQTSPQPTRQDGEEARETQPNDLNEGAKEEVEDEPPQQWQAYVPPPQRSYAARPDEISDSQYVPALTAEGLETVGGVGNWWDQEAHWPKSADFAGFKPLEKVVDPAIIEAAVRRAVVEAFALRQAGLEEELVKAWPIAGEIRQLMEVDVNVADNGAVSLTGDVSAVIESLNQKDEATADESAAAEGPALDASVLSAEEAQKYRDTWGHGWKTASLSDPRIKFAVTKRIFQLTGQLVHDHQLSSISDVRSLLHAVQTPPKPKTLTQELQERRQDLIQLPNVSVAAKRITRGDKEKALGRFKLIEEELKKRDLPLDGHGFVRKNRELSRLKGGV